ncbi:MAG: 2-thiouracil desulfurase family protein [Planctomycetota bacterium]|jgi:uncharacterized protein YbbK (DUF523 family)
MKSACVNQGNHTQTILVSSCLYGLKTRYNCSSKPTNKINFTEKNTVYLPICPEQLGGLSTPRPEATLAGGDGYDVLNEKAKAVVINSGNDLTSSFTTGAECVLDLVRHLGISKAYLKSKSPSCGVSSCYIDGKLQSGTGVTAALLKLNSVQLEEVDG